MFNYAYVYNSILMESSTRLKEKKSQQEISSINPVKFIREIKTEWKIIHILQNAQLTPIIYFPIKHHLPFSLTNTCPSKNSANSKTSAGLLKSM